ncbi:MAG TPA: chorismate-binding protein [Candidatus Rubrimentiphilum sp.]|nr:chorismate-binding protein [Candidatus Rubrimentiphilum sp.]
MTPPVPRTARETYDQTIGAIRSAIGDGEVYQVNYTLPFDFSFSGEPFDAYCLLAKQSAARYCAYVEDGDRTLLSFSPELFLEFDGGRLVTKPMKGTAPPAAAAELDNDKNRAEHLMIVDLLRNDLHKICRDVTVERLFSVERYPTFATMTSTISGTLAPERRLSEVFRATFPCGSVTGAPKRAAMAHIAQFEPQTRGVYTGSIGYLTPERRGWWNVAIRTLQIDRAQTSGRLDAGGGIVSDSQAGEEWREVLLKTAFLNPALGAFACLETLRCGPQPSDVRAHLGRLRATAEHFGIVFDDAELQRGLEELNARAFPALVRIRLAFDGTVSVAAEPLQEHPERLGICVSDERVDSNDAMLRYKTSWRPAHDAAADCARRSGCFDALLRNERDELTEGSRTNLFVRIGETLFTPPLSSGVLPGILRNAMVSRGEAVERVLNENDLRSANEVFVGNSARGLLKTHLVSERDRV